MEQSQAHPELVSCRPEEEPGRRLNSGVARRYRLLAIPAPPAEQQIGDEGNVIPGPDGLPTVRAVGGGPNHRLAARHAVDHDVQEAADHKPEKDSYEDYQAILLLQGDLRDTATRPEPPATQ